MRIRSDGRIGLNSPGFSNFSCIVRQVGSDAFPFFVENTAQQVLLQVQSDGAVAALDFVETSDARLKHNIDDIHSALDKVKALRGVTFEWNEEIPHTPGTQIGFIAQEVEKVLPEVVQTDSEGMKSVAYGNMAALLVEAIKEQEARIAALESKLDSANATPLLKSALGWPAVGLLGLGLFAVARRRRTEGVETA